jgi:hypothetical protein
LPVTEVHTEGEGDEVLDLEDFPTWPIAVQVQDLERISPDAVVNAGELGGLRFEGVDEQYAQIVQILRDLRLEDWDMLPTDLVGEITTNVDDLLNAVREMVALSPASDGDWQNTRNALQARFTDRYAFFRNRVRPVCLTARLVHVLHTQPQLWGGDVSAERLQKLQEQFSQLQETADQFRTLAPLVESQRQVIGQSGAADLSAYYAKRARDHAESFVKWAVILFATIALFGAVAVIFVYKTRPSDNATNAQIVTHILTDLLVLGLVVFVVRFASLQTRGHRHMQFVASNKSNALSTFNRIVAGQDDPEVRATVASALAQAVFKSEDAIFSDASHDTVTIIERMGAVVSSRLPTG